MLRRSQVGLHQEPVAVGGIVVSVTQPAISRTTMTTTSNTTITATTSTTAATTSNPTTAATTTTNHSLLRSVDVESRIAWVSRALCRTADPDELFVRGAAQRKAAVICRHCPVMMECGADALDNRVEFGVWGGMTERQRRALLKQHPEVTSWSEFFANNQRDHQRTAVS